MTKKRAENTPLDQIVEAAENDADAASEAVTLVFASIDRLATRAKELEQENAALKSSLHEATELLRRGRDYADEIDLDVGWQMDVDAFLDAMNGMTEREKEDDTQE